LLSFSVVNGKILSRSRNWIIKQYSYSFRKSAKATGPTIFISTSLLSENAQPTKQEIEDNFDANLCRCTGMVFQELRSQLKKLMVSDPELATILAKIVWQFLFHHVFYTFFPSLPSYMCVH
jgi:hypothetical protein